MITVERLTRDDGTSYDEYRGLPADPRPTEGLTVGDIFVEIRTGKEWKWTGTDWDRVEFTEVKAPVDNVTTEDATSALSAKQGKLLNDRVNNLSNLGRYLALWDCATGKPTTNPGTLPYTYKSGDYYRVSNTSVKYKHTVAFRRDNGTVHTMELILDTATPYTSASTFFSEQICEKGYNYYPGTTTAEEIRNFPICTDNSTHFADYQGGWSMMWFGNEALTYNSVSTARDCTLTDTVTACDIYKPSGTSYNDEASTTVESNPVAVDDVYFYDGTSWSLQINHKISPTATTITIAVADWNSGTTCTKTVSGVTASNVVIVDPSDASIECTAQAANSLTFTASATPSAAITVKVVIF